MDVKLSYWHTPGTEPLSPLTLGRLVDIAADRWADREALVSVYQGHRFTFSQLRNKVKLLAGGLLRLGVKPGDRLAIWGYNSSEVYMAYLATASIGVITVKLNPALEVPEVVSQLRKVKSEVLIYAERYYDMVKQVKTSLPDLTVINMGQRHHQGSLQLSDVMSDISTAMLDQVERVKTQVQPDDPCDILFSSGSTGSPKAALLSHHGMVNNTLITGRRMGMDLQVHKWCVTTQFCHGTASVTGIHSCVLYGGTFVIPSEQYTGRDTVNILQEERCTIMLGIPSQLVDIVDIASTKDITFPDLKVIGVGGAPVSSALVYAVQRTIPSAKVLGMLGMTETTCVSFMSLLEDSVEKVASTTGYVTDHIQVKLVDSEGRMVPMGTPGELWVRGFTVMLRYWDDEEKTKDAIRSDGWLKTGDQMVLTEDGYGRVVGRLKEMIIRENQNIFPLEIEQFLQGHPDILDVQAFGVPDDKVGEEMCAYVRTRSDVTLTEQDVKDYCKGKIAEWKIPRYVLFTDTFPRSATGKVIKRELQEEALNKLHLDNTHNMLYVPELHAHM